MTRPTEGKNAVEAPATLPTAPAGSPRQLAWLYTPESARDDVAALFELEAEIAHGARPGLEHAVAHARLAWWLEETSGLASGKGRHPLARRLLASFAGLALSPPDLRGLATVAQIDLACAAFESEQEYRQYLQAWSHGLFRNLALRLCPAADDRPAVERFVALAGPALRDLELLARLADDARVGRVHSVIEPDPGRAPATVESWQRQPWPTGPDNALLERIGGRRGELRRAAGALPASLRAAQRPLLAWCALGCELGDRCQASLPLQYHPGRLAPLRAGWTAWRAAVAAARGRLPPTLKENR